MTEKLSVLVDARMAHWSGVGRYTCGITHALLEREDIAITLLCSSDALSALGSVQAPVINAESNPLLPQGERELLKAATSSSFDVIHCMQYPMPSKKPSASIVVTLHDLIPLVVTSSMPSLIKRCLYRRKNLKAISFSSRIIAPSAATKHDLESVLGASSKAITVIPEAADDFVEGEVSCPRKPAPFVLAIGNTRPHKNLEVLVAAMHTLVAENAAYDSSATRVPTLYLVGNPDEQWLREQMEAYPSLKGFISFTGRLSDSELRGYYKEAKAFLSPSLYEGFGLPPLEAMGMGTPVISSGASSLPEVVGGGGILLDPCSVQEWADSIRLICGDDEYANQLQRKGILQYKQFSWEKAAVETVKVYRTAIHTGIS